MAIDVMFGDKVPQNLNMGFVTASEAGAFKDGIQLVALCEDGGAIVRDTLGTFKVSCLDKILKVDIKSLNHIIVASEKLEEIISEGAWLKIISSKIVNGSTAKVRFYSDYENCYIQAKTITGAKQVTSLLVKNIEDCAEDIQETHAIILSFMTNIVAQKWAGVDISPDCTYLNVSTRQEADWSTSDTWLREIKEGKVKVTSVKKALVQLLSSGLGWELFSSLIRGIQNECVFSPVLPLCSESITVAIESVGNWKAGCTQINP
jgi:hypothetical protein